MIALFLFFLAIPPCVFVLLWLLRIRSKKFLLGVPIAIFLLPFIIGISLYLLRAPIQQGAFLTDFGPVLSWAFPPEDLYLSLAEQKIIPEKKTYNFKLTHKYVGNHAISVEIPSAENDKWERERMLTVTTNFTDGQKTIFGDSSDQGSPYKSRDAYGYYYVGYKVPKDVPVAKNLTMKIKVKGDIRQFLEKHNNAKFVVRKSSDQ